jgi:GH15 family glucan-1,4-alpha-glucosidase
VAGAVPKAFLNARGECGLGVVTDNLGNLCEGRAGVAELREPILARAWNPARGALTGALDGDELDASLLLLAELGLVAATDLRFVSICNAIGRELCRNGRIMRYTNDDGFGAPETAFLVYNLWHIDALAAIGRRD